MADSLASSAWAPTDIAGTVPDPEIEVFIQFDEEGNFSGRDGCNRMMGRYLTNADAILLGPIATTMMLCEGPAADLAKPFTDALSAARQFEQDDASLTLRDGAGEIVMTLQQREPE